MAKRIVTEEICEQLAMAAKQESRRIGVGVTLSVTDEAGNLLLLQKFGNAILPSLEISAKKAYTAAVLRQPTAEFGQIAQVGQSAFGINVTNDKLVIFGGGFPLQIKGETVGGIGVSGGSVEEDETVAHAVLKVFAKFAEEWQEE
ncbi:heme-binding protein [Ruminococcaceae bacterium OttesenSCG-928-A16]|nr:heme-binding protein [Ruminococcaceae bacterium OttesenSCG-928-A16]